MYVCVCVRVCATHMHILMNSYIILTHTHAHTHSRFSQAWIYSLRSSDVFLNAWRLCQDDARYALAMREREDDAEAKVRVCL
jgi:hypothetical protein